MQTNCAESDSVKKAVDVVIPVKDGGPMLINAVTGWLSQELPSGWKMNLIIVNDGSVDGIPEELERRFGSRLRMIHHEISMGRAIACNAGAAASDGEYVAFFDADCISASNDVLKNHIKALQNGATLTFGSLQAQGFDFWARYLRRVTLLREQRFKAGDQAALTTANCVIRRDIFDAVNGFDERYKHYGFEDRDLILRLLKSGACASLANNAGVIHDDLLSLGVVSRKMRTAGRFTAPLFASTHHDIYKKMDFYRVDARCHGAILRLFARCITPSLYYVVRMGDWLLRAPVPFGVKVGVVKVCSGVAYLVGSSEAQR